jgi:hypothetical protein
VFAGEGDGATEARPLLDTSPNMIVLRVALYLVMLSLVAVRERWHAALRSAAVRR